MRIIIVSDFFIPHYSGGGERRYFEIGRRLAERGHEVRVLCMRHPNVPDVEEFEGMRIHHIGPKIENPPHRSMLDFLHFTLSCLHFLCGASYDVIDAQTYAPLVPSFVASKLSKKRMIATVHDVYGGEWEGWIYNKTFAKLVENVLIRLPYSRIITVSQASKDKIARVSRSADKRVIVVHNGVDREFIDSVKQKKKEEGSVLFVGRLTKYKHVDDLLEAFSEILQERKSTRLRIVGDGVVKSGLKSLVRDLGVKDSVEFLGDLEYTQVIEEMKKAAVLVLPSTREGFGLVLAEAGACRTPAIAYDTGGVVEVINDGENGFLIEPRNIEKLKEKTLLLLRDKKLRKKMGESGRKIAEEKFSWDEIAEKVLEVYLGK